MQDQPSGLLSDLERCALELVPETRDYHDIAAALDVSEQTIADCLRTALLKLDAAPTEP